jgi:glycosyltransferase involved in cell wall biosynthesis
MSCFNASEWLSEAIESVLRQTCTHFELIVVDDGSTDGTSTILERYRRIDKRLVVLRKANTGLADSLNAGMAVARGEWIARLDADDLCEGTRLAEQLRFLDNHPSVVLLGSGFTEIDARGREIARHIRPTTHSKLVRHLERLQRFFPHSSAVFRRSLAQELGGYNKFFKKTQDWDLWLRLSERGEVACVPLYLVRVRSHANQIRNAAAGRPQIVYGGAAAVSHFLRLEGYNDPSTGKSEDWDAFLSWVDAKMAEEGILEGRVAWSSARNAYFQARNRLFGITTFIRVLFRSGQAVRLISERLFAFSFPSRLAREWMLRTGTQSQATAEAPARTVDNPF